MSAHVVSRKFRSLLFHISRKIQHIKEIFAGVDFATPVGKEAAGIENAEDAHYYESSAGVSELTRALDHISPTENDAVLDYGAGKGGALAHLAKYRFRRVAGVELSEKLAEICRSNMRKLGLAHVEVYHADAARFDDLDEFNVFYFFNPFRGQVFADVLNNIVASYGRRHRVIYLLYYYPTCHDAIMRLGVFRLEKSFVDGSRKLNIYKLSG